MATESPLKVMENAFHFTLKALFVLKIFKFLCRIFGHVEKQLDQKDKINFKIHDATTWFRNKCNTDIVNISRSKENQTVKFGQLIEHCETFFLKNHIQNVVKKLVPDLFLKNQNGAYTVCFYCKTRLRTIEYILKRNCRPLAFTS